MTGGHFNQQGQLGTATGTVSVTVSRCWNREDTESRPKRPESPTPRFPKALSAPRIPDSSATTHAGSTARRGTTKARARNRPSASPCPGGSCTVSARFGQNHERGAAWVEAREAGRLISGSLLAGWRGPRCALGRGEVASHRRAFPSPRCDRHGWSSDGSSP